MHRALETHSIPKNLNLTDAKKLSPIFRDTTELTAHHDLSEKIREAVQRSKYLIVLCSPAAKQSHWVNEEIRLFRKLHGEASILSVLAEGTPKTSFPPALLEGGREPLAANLGGGKDSFKLGTTQLAASMLGVGLDTLIRRETKRRRRRLQLITASALAFSGVMGVTAFTAVEARNDAQDSRAQAESLVEYMITDLKEKLEPVGRLDILDSVGDKAVNYYDTQELKQLNNESRLRQARSRHIIAQVALDAKNMVKAEQEIETAFSLTQEILSRNPDDPSSMFAHAQSEYWMGALNYMNKNYGEALPYWNNYNVLGRKLYELDPLNVDWVMEAASGENNLGLLSRRIGNLAVAQSHYEKAAQLVEEALLYRPNDRILLEKLSNFYAGLANALHKSGNTQAAKTYRFNNLGILERLVNMSDTPDQNHIFKLARARIKYAYMKHESVEDQCQDKSLLQGLKTLETLLNIDHENTTWRHDYFLYNHTYIKKCHSYNKNKDKNDLIYKTIKASRGYLDQNKIQNKVRELEALVD